MKTARFAFVSSLFLFSYIVNVEFASAEIRFPYIVDEKPQVIFGDSIQVGTKQGLENYTADYVGGYLHITFTTTHAHGGYAAYPAKIVITPEDPRLMQLRNFIEVNNATQANTASGLPTDYYSVDIQFFSSGYRIITKRGIQDELVLDEYFPVSNMDDNTFVSLANDYPYQVPPTYHSMSFTPMRLTPEPVAGNSSVLFIPGLQASRLYKKAISNCTVNCEDQLWEPNINSDVEDLYLNPDGTSIKPSVYTRDIILETNTPVPSGLAGQNIYKRFSEMMDGLVSTQKIKEWKSYPYDWRKSVDEVVNTPQDLGNGQTVLLLDTLQNLVASSTNGKVTIVAHSNGGLIAKALLKKLQDDKTAGRNNLIDKIDVLILVAVPEIGTAKTVPAILHGYDSQMLLGWLLDETRARELGRNMKSAYGLIPSQKYIESVSASPVTFRDSLVDGPTHDMFQAYGSAVSSYTEYKNFLFGSEGRITSAIAQTSLPIKLTQSLFAEAESLHGQIDNFVPPSTLRVIEVAGWGLDTVASFEYYPKYTCNSNTGLNACTTILDQRPRFTVDGDKTVVVPSAHYMSFQGKAEKYWVDLPKHNRELRRFRRNREHKDILEVESLNNYISTILKNEPPVTNLVFTSSLPTSSTNRLRLSIHSPVTIDGYDLNGNHTGKVCPPSSDFCYIEENILNSSYLEFGEGKYINMPEEEFAKIKLQGTGIGTFTYESEKVLTDGTSTTTSFVGIPVTTQSLAEITASSTTGQLELRLDVSGDGVFDFTLSPNSEFDPVQYLQIMKETIYSLDIPLAKKTALGKRVDKVIDSIQKGKIDRAKLRVDRFKEVLEKNISKTDLKNPKPKKLSKTDAQMLLDMLNQLLDNLG